MIARADVWQREESQAQQPPPCRDESPGRGPYALLVARTRLELVMLRPRWPAPFPNHAG